MNVRMIRRLGKLGVGVIGKVGLRNRCFLGTTVLEINKQNIGA